MIDHCLISLYRQQQSAWTACPPEPVTDQQQHCTSTPISESRAPRLTTPMIQRKYSPALSSLKYPPLKIPEHEETLCPEPPTQYAQPPPNQPQQHHYGYHQGYAQSRGYKSNHQTNGDYHDLSEHEQGCYDEEEEGLSSSHSMAGEGVMDNTMFMDRPTPGCSSSASVERSGSTSAERSGSAVDQYFESGGHSTKTQIEILYQAKSAQLQELTEKYELLKLESSKELRVLRHENALIQGTTEQKKQGVSWEDWPSRLFKMISYSFNGFNVTYINISIDHRFCLL